MDRTNFTAGMKNAAAICLGVIPVGISYGLLAVQAGLSRVQTVLMSALVMAGSSQLMAVGMLGHSTIMAIVTAVFFVNLRHIVMSCSVMSRLEKTSLRKKLLCAFALCDESFAIFSLSGRYNAEYLLGINTILYATWLLSSFAGCMLGQILPQIVSKSFGIAFYAAFLAMLVPNVAKNKKLICTVLLTAVVNAVLQIFLPMSRAVIISMLVGAAAGTLFSEVSDDE